MRALDPQAQAWLRAEKLPDHLAAQVPEPLPRCAYKSAQLGSLWQCFHDQLTDPRAPRGRRHLLSTILTIAAVATVAGERGPKGFARFAGELSQPQRRHLRCRPHPPTGVRQVPSEPTFRRASKRLDQVQFHAVLAEWLAAHDPEKYTAVAVDDKTVKSSRQKDGRPVHLMSAVTHHTQRLLNQIPSRKNPTRSPPFARCLSRCPSPGCSSPPTPSTVSARTHGSSSTKKTPTTSSWPKVTNPPWKPSPKANCRAVSPSVRHA